MFKKLRRIWKKITCKHNRQISFYPDNVHYMFIGKEIRNNNGIIHDTIVVKGCLDCGKVWVEDYGE